VTTTNAPVRSTGHARVPPGTPSRGTLLLADRVVTLGRGRVDARAVLVRGSRVVWVGDDPAQAPPHQHRLDLAGTVIGPAFVDAHAHLTPLGLSQVTLDLSDAASGAELLRLVATYAAQHTGRVIWGHGFDPHRYPDGLPTPEQLSEVTPGRGVYLSRIDGHASLVDHDTLAAAPLARANGVVRDAGGRPTGLLKRESNHIVRRWAIGAMDERELSEARRPRRATRRRSGSGRSTRWRVPT
jgi:predicted amidohydrolase YtcJ